MCAQVFMHACVCARVHVYGTYYKIYHIYERNINLLAHLFYTHTDVCLLYSLQVNKTKAVRLLRGNQQLFQGPWYILPVGLD